MRTIVLWSPDWPITAVRRLHDLPARSPIALIDRGIVFACSAAARADGVTRGLRLREAQARCNDILTFPYESIVDHRAFEPVISALEQLTPGVQLLRPGTVAVRSRGPARYYGGEKPAALAIIGCLDDLEIGGTRIGIADGPFTAEQAARRTGQGVGADAVRIIPAGGSPAFLAPLPISLITENTGFEDASSDSIATLLRRLGIATLGDFARLTALDVRERFGQQGARLHTLASGLDGRPVAVRVPPQQLEVAVDFEPPLDRIDQATFGVRASVDGFIEGLTRAKLVATAVRIEVDTEEGDISERTWLHPRSFTAADVVDRVRWQLQGAGEVDSGLRSRIIRVTIAPEAVDAIGNHEAGLWGSGPDERIHHGLSRVQGMIGHTAVLTAAVGGGRMLSDRQDLLPWGDRAKTVSPRPAARPWPGQLPPPVPAMVYEVPRPVLVTAADGGDVAVDDRGMVSAPPASFSHTGSARELRQVTAWAGPWPITERWWDADATRRADRFQIVDSTGSAWLLVLEGEHWFAEARYD